LGLAPTLEDEFAIVLDANGVELRIQKVQTLPQSHTQLGWSVISLEEVVRGLRAKGVARKARERSRAPSGTGTNYIHPWLQP
jgi:hypothetical protein